MEQIEEKPQGGLLKASLNHGLIISAIMIVITLVLYLIGQLHNTAAGWISFAIMIIALVWAMINYKKENLGGFMTYGQGLGYAVMVGLWVGIFTGVFALLLYGVISPELIAEEKAMIERNVFRQFEQMDYDQQLGMINLQQRFITPYWKLIFSILGGAFNGLIVGLIASAFVKKSNPDLIEG